MGWNLFKYALDLQKSGEVSLTLQMPFYPSPMEWGFAVSSSVLFGLRYHENLRGEYEYEVVVGLVGLAVVLLLFLTGIELGFAMALVGFLGFSSSSP